MSSIDLITFLKNINFKPKRRKQHPTQQKECSYFTKTQIVDSESNSKNDNFVFSLLVQRRSQAGEIGERQSARSGAGHSLQAGGEGLHQAPGPDRPLLPH